MGLRGRGSRAGPSGALGLERSKGCQLAPPRARTPTGRRAERAAGAEGPRSTGRRRAAGLAAGRAAGRAAFGGTSAARLAEICLSVNAARETLYAAQGPEPEPEPERPSSALSSSEPCRPAGRKIPGRVG